MKISRCFRILVVSGALLLIHLQASHVLAVGARPEDPTELPEPTVPPLQTPQTGPQTAPVPAAPAVPTPATVRPQPVEPVEYAWWY